MTDAYDKACNDTINKTYEIAERTDCTIANITVTGNDITIDLGLGQTLTRSQRDSITNYAASRNLRATIR